MRDSIMQRASELAYCLWPMLCPPNDWSNEERGGYLTEFIRANGPMVRTRSSLGPSMQGEIPIEMLNNLQRVSYRINPAVMSVANWAYDNFRTIGKFKRETALPIPASPGEDASEEQIKDYKRSRRIVEDHNAQIEQKNWRTTETMFVARKYQDEKQWWLSWSYDYRGRVYPQLTSLTPQGTDFDKSLFYFAEEGAVNERWLAWHCSTTYGNDKWSHEDRVQWTYDNLELIKAVATDPVGNLDLWADAADEPWCFLAAATEFYECCIAKTKKTSGLPIGVDATCSGLQHLSAMTLNAGAGAMVNVTPTPKPADGYKAVAEASIKYISDEEVHPHITRKITKRCTMCLCYGLTRTSARDYIRQALHDETDLDLKVEGRLSEIVEAIYEKATAEIFPGPVKVMEWLKRTAKGLIENNDTIEWTTPSGFRVVQDARHSLTERVKTNLMGSVVKTNVAVGFGKPKPQDHVKQLPPNLVHSWDAALLHLTFAKWDKPFLAIHDCVLGRSSDMDQMQTDIRHHFVEMYRKRPLEDWANQVGVTVPEGMIEDTLDIDQVNDSPYFFC